MDKNDLLLIEDLSVSYGKEETVKNVSFSVKEGEIVGIVGESGSGKTTVLRSVLSLLGNGGKINNGKIMFAGRDIVSLSVPSRSELAGKDIAMIFQDSEKSLDPVRTIGKQFIEAIRVHEKISRSEAEKKGKDELIAMNFNDADQVWKSYPFELSGGMCQRVAIAMAMVHHPKLLLADEPTSALDVTIQAQVVDLLMELRKKTGTSILIVTHNMGVASKMADRIGVMYKGELAEFGEKREVLFNPKHPYTKALINRNPYVEELS
ncbi:MAG: ABC transporter ATP-binding protein [Butyrivibrio sp.]|nr:ABC transporter ATP-binding protein [Butyrivibrio sp.]